MYQEDVDLATYVNNQIVNNLNMKNRGVKQEQYYVIRNMVIPSILVELGFLTNAEDNSKMTNDQYVKLFAESIYKAISLCKNFTIVCFLFSIYPHKRKTN